MIEYFEIEPRGFINRQKARFSVKLCRWLYRHGLYGMAEAVNRTHFLYMAGVDMSEISRAAQAKKTAGQEPRTGKWSNTRQGGDEH